MFRIVVDTPEPSSTWAWLTLVVSNNRRQPNLLSTRFLPVVVVSHRGPFDTRVHEGKNVRLPTSSEDRILQLLILLIFPTEFLTFHCPFWE